MAGRQKNRLAVSVVVAFAFRSVKPLEGSLKPGNLDSCLMSCMTASRLLVFSWLAMTSITVPQLDEVVSHRGSHLPPGSSEPETRERVSFKH